MSTLPLAFIVLLIVVVTYFINRDIYFKSKIYLLEKELEEYKEAIENKKTEKNIDNTKLKNVFSKDEILRLKESQLQENFSQN